MKKYPIRSVALVFMLSAAAACTGTTTSGGGAGGESAALGPGGTIPEPRPGVLDGAYSSWKLEYTQAIGADGYPYTLTNFVYFFRVFNAAASLVYMGDPKPNLEDMWCTAATVDSRGTPLCASYSVADGQISIDGHGKSSLKWGDTSWSMDGHLLSPMLSQAGTSLDGSYESYSCYLSTCSHATISFKPDGHYSLSSFSLSGYATDSISMFSSGGATRTGTYEILAHSMRITPDGGTPVTQFYFRDVDAKRDTVQIGDTWYKK